MKTGHLRGPVSAALFTGIFVLSFVKICDYDIWYHLAAAKWMFANFSIPRMDPFSFTASGRPWIDAAWLSQIVFYLSYLAGGLKSLVVLKALLVTSAFVIIYRSCRLRGASTAVTIGVILLAVAACRGRFTLRPHLFSMICIACLTVLIERLRQAKFRPGPRLCIQFGLLQVIWANLHSGAVLGAAYMWLLTFSEAVWFSLAKYGKTAIKRIKGVAPKELWVLMVLAVAMTGLSLMNPFGWKTLGYGAFTLKEEIYRTFIVELRSVQFSKDFAFFWSFGLLGLLSFAVNARRRFADIVVFLVMFAAACSSRRLIPEFVLMNTPALAANLAGARSLFISKKFLKRIRGHGWTVAGSAAAVCMIAAFVCVMQGADQRMITGLGVNRTLFPVRQAEFVRREQIRGRMFNTMAFGGYLIWALDRDNPVFIDGRTDVYWPRLLYEEVKFYHPEIWDNLVKTWDLDYVIVSNLDEERRYPCRHLDKLSGEWALVQWDDTGLVYVRRERFDPGWIDRHEYRYINPNSVSMDYLSEAVRQPGVLSQVKEELRRVIKESPVCLAALDLLSFVHRVSGNTGDAVRVMEDAMFRNPKNAHLMIRLSELYIEVGRYGEAEKALHKSARMFPGSAVVWSSLGDLHFKTNEFSDALRYYRKALASDPDNPQLQSRAATALNKAIKQKKMLK